MSSTGPSAGLTTADRAGGGPPAGRAGDGPPASRAGDGPSGGRAGDGPSGGHEVAPVVDAAHAVAFGTRAEYAAAIERIRAAATAYYAGDDLAMDDATYDALLARTAATEQARPGWAASDSPTVTVGAGVAAGDVPHSTPMLSLDNVFDAEELRGWATRLERTLGGPAHGYTVEPKIDGMAIAARYVDGRLRQVATRGDGRAGEDVTTQARLVAGLPAELRRPVTVEVRGEVFMTDADFARANELRTAHGGQAFANPRSAAAGTLRAQDRAYDAPLSFLAYAVHDLPDGAGLTHSAAMAAIAELGVATTAGSPAGMPRCATIGELSAAIAAMGAARGTLGFDIDGAVVKADDPGDRDRAGSSSRAPRWAIAYKFPADTRTSKLVGIEVQVGRTGVITPVAVLEPVQVGGVVVTSATLHNFGDLVRRDVRVGDTVFVRRAGEVIPEITGAKLDERPAEAEPFTPPAACPRCGGEIDRAQKRWRCTQGRACGAGESLSYFAARDSMDIEGLGDKVIAGVVAAGLVADPADLYDLTPESLAELDRLGRTSATKLAAAIQASKAQPLSRVLTGLGVRMTGRSMSRRLARHFGSMAALRAATVEELQEVDAVGPERATTIAAELIDLGPVIDKLAARGVTMTEPGVPDRAAPLSVLPGGASTQAGAPGGATTQAGASGGASTQAGASGGATTQAGASGGGAAQAGAPGGGAMRVGDPGRGAAWVGDSGGDPMLPGAGAPPLRKEDGKPMTVVVTGSVPGLTRNEGNEAVEDLGGKSSGSVSARTDLVVIGPGAGSKAAKAEQLGIRIMPSERFADLLAAHHAGERPALTDFLD